MVKQLSQFRVDGHKRHMEYMRNLPIASMQHFRALPENFTWRNASGINYVTPVRPQMNCGSCYIFSTLGMFEARDRITKKVNSFYSPQYVVNCNPLGQGWFNIFIFLFFYF